MVSDMYPVKLGHRSDQYYYDYNYHSKISAIIMNTFIIRVK